MKSLKLKNYVFCACQGGVLLFVTDFGLNLISLTFIVPMHGDPWFVGIKFREGASPETMHYS